MGAQGWKCQAGGTAGTRGQGVAARKRRSTEGGGYREAKGDERLLNSFAGMKTNGMVALSS